jgi:predicted CXXCH cytochrome family protein
MSHTMRVCLLTVFCVSLLATGTALASKACFQCHDKKQFTAKYVHKPVNQGECATCHNPHVARHKGLLRSREDQLCYSCHEKQKNDFSKGVVHQPVSKGQCSICHEPHVSEKIGLVREDLATVCLTCHKGLKQDFKVTHKPFAEGSCGSCHRPHQGDNLELLTDAPDTLCMSCHEESKLLSSHKGYPEKPSGCLSCHAPHGSDMEALIRNVLHQPYIEDCAICHGKAEGRSTASCLSCHENVKEEMHTTHSHLTLRDGNSCLNCHSPHAGNDRALLKGPERLLCSGCHQSTLHEYKMKRSKHPRLKKCSLCHMPHGSDNLAMTRGDSNEVCINCHKTQGNFTHPIGPEVLDSHTGQMVTCASCHNPMGTDHAFHLRAEGKKELCILCHRTY